MSTEPQKTSSSLEAAEHAPPTAQQIDSLAAINEARRMKAEPPPKPVGSRLPSWAWKLIAVGAIGLVGGGLRYVAKSADPNEQALNEMQRLLEKKWLASPSTAKWLDRRVLSHEKTWWLGYFELDSQNTYGATVRSRLCVAVEIEGAEIRWRPGLFVEENCEPSHEELLTIWKNGQGWGKPIVPGKLPGE